MDNTPTLKPAAKPIALVVDDESVIQDLLRRYLQTIGFEALAASDGEQAFKLCAVAQPKLVLLDITLRGESGLEILQGLESKYPALIVIMLTAVQDDQIGEMARRFGASDYLTKPVDLSTLNRALKTHLLFAA